MCDEYCAGHVLNPFLFTFKTPTPFERLNSTVIFSWYRDIGRFLPTVHVVGDGAGARGGRVGGQRFVHDHQHVAAALVGWQRPRLQLAAQRDLRKQVAVSAFLLRLSQTLSNNAF